MIAGMDFLTVITANFRILYCLFLIRHSRREIIHFNVTEHPTSEWVVQQIREAFSDSSDERYLIFDRDAKFGADVQGFWTRPGFLPYAPATEARGRTELPKGGFEVFETICWT
jgi:hypothetical protein